MKLDLNLIRGSLANHVEMVRTDENVVIFARATQMRCKFSILWFEIVVILHFTFYSMRRNVNMWFKKNYHGMRMVYTRDIDKFENFLLFLFLKSGISFTSLKMFKFITHCILAIMNYHNT